MCASIVCGERTRRLSNALRGLLLSASMILASAVVAGAQDLSPWLKLETPGHFTLRIFGAGYGAEKYAATHQGFELTQSVTRDVAVIARVSAYQILKGTGFDNPLEPSPHSAIRNFGRLEGGFGVTPIQGTSFALLGGEDFGDSDALVFENNFSSWLWLQSRHPLNLAYSSSHYFENGVTNGLIDLRTVALSTGRWMLLLGAGGAIWGGGAVGQAKGQGGPDVGLFIRQWHTGIDLQVGYGSSRTYGTLSITRSFSWED
jgi:hypothetical protein